MTLKKLWLEMQFKEIKEKLQLFIASGLAKTLSPLLPSTVDQTTPVIPTAAPPVTATTITSSTNASTSGLCLCTYTNGDQFICMYILHSVQNALYFICSVILLHIKAGNLDCYRILLEAASLIFR